MLTAVDPETTTADVTTDLSITGKPAQFGRGVIQDVSDKLLNEFVACLESKLAPAPEEVAPAAPAAAAAEEAPAPSEARPAEERPEVEALDLGATVLPILLKTYWKQLAAGFVVLFVLWRVLRRRR